MSENGTMKRQQQLATIASTTPVGKSGVDLERQAILAQSNTAASVPGIDGARLEQIKKQNFMAFNLSATNLANLQKILAKAFTELVEIHVVGTSIDAGCTNGVTPAFDRLNSWPIKMRDELVRQGYPDGSSGFVRIQDSTNRDTRWVLSGAWTGFQCFAYLAGAGTATYTANKAGTRVVVTYFSLAGSNFTVSINGASSGAGFATVNGAGAGTWSQVVLNAPIAAGQTVVITRTAGDLYLAGIIVTNAVGIVVHNIAQSGSFAVTGSNTDGTSWAADTDVGLGRVMGGGNAAVKSAPDIVMIAVGPNDMQGAGKTNDTMKKAIEKIRNYWPTALPVLVASVYLNTTLVDKQRWFNYMRSLGDLAAEWDVPLFSFGDYLGDYATMVANGDTTDGQGHLVSATSQKLGKNIGAALGQ